MSIGLMVLWTVFMTLSQVLCPSALLWYSMDTLPHLVPSGFVCPGFPVSTETTFSIRWSLNTFGPPGQLSTQLSWNVKETETSSCVATCANVAVRVMAVDSLTFQILFLLAHCPRADLLVDHIDARQAVPSTEWNYLLQLHKDKEWSGATHYWTVPVEAKTTNTALDRLVNRVHPGARIHFLPAACRDTRSMSF